MKKMTFMLVLLFACLSINAQIIEFTDANFKQKLVTAASDNPVAKNLNGEIFKIDANSNGEIEQDEALNVSYLEIKNTGINNLSGIGYFTNLQTLFCNNNTLTKLDVSLNTKLTYLNCSYNQLTELVIKNTVVSQEINFANNPSIKSICVDANETFFIETKLQEYGYQNISITSDCSNPCPTLTNNSSIDFCSFDLPTIENLTAHINVSDIKWYTSATYTETILPNTPLENGKKYYGVKTKNCSTIRYVITAKLYQGMTVDVAARHTELCKNSTVGDLQISISYKDNIYDSSASNEPLSASTLLNENTTYYLGYAGIRDCTEYYRTPIFITYKDCSVECPTITENVTKYFCSLQNPTFKDIAAEFDASVIWDNALPTNEYLVDPFSLPVNDGDIYYGIKTTDCSPIRYEITVKINQAIHADVAPMKLEFCDNNNPTVQDLKATIQAENIYALGNILLPTDPLENGMVYYTTPEVSYENSKECVVYYNTPIFVNIQQCLNTPNFTASEQLAIYPNPVQNTLNIEAKNGTQLQTVAIYNLQGQLVLDLPNVTQTNFDVSGLAKGMYLVQIQTNKGNTTTKLVKE